MADINITVNRALADKLVTAYKDLGAYTKQLSIDLVKEEGALTCREAIKYSPPLDGISGGKGDKKIALIWGNWAVANDIGLTVSEDSKSLGVAINSKRNARQKFEKWRAGKPPKTSGIISKIWLDTDTERAFKRASSLFKNWNGRRINVIENDSALEARHNRLRKLYKGRIGKNSKGNLRGEPPAFAELSLIKSYTKRRQLKVGWMKAGWVTAINKIGKPMINGMPKSFGLRKLPTWITRHKAGHGGVGLNIYGGAGTNNVMMIVRNDLANIFGVGYLAGTKREVMAVRAGKMTKRLRHFMRIAINKVNNNQSPK
jgi:hypothetical protein